MNILFTTVTQINSLKREENICCIFGDRGKNSKMRKNTQRNCSKKYLK